MSVDFDIGAALRSASTLERVAGGMERVRQRAVSTLQRRLQAEAGRAIPARFNVQPKYVKPRLSVDTEGRHAVLLRGSGKPLEAHLFGGEYGGRLTPGASWQVLVGGERKIDPGTFVRKNDRARKIMTRVPARGDSAQRVQRLPIKTVYGPDVGSMLLSDTVGDELGAFGARIMADEVARLVSVELRGL